MRAMASEAIKIQLTTDPYNLKGIVLMDFPQLLHFGKYECTLLPLHYSHPTVWMSG